MPDGVDVVGVGAGVSSGWGREAAVLRGESHAGSKDQCVAVRFHDGTVFNSESIDKTGRPLSGLKLAAAACVGDR